MWNITKRAQYPDLGWIPRQILLVINEGNFYFIIYNNFIFAVHYKDKYFLHCIAHIRMTRPFQFCFFKINYSLTKI